MVAPTRKPTSITTAITATMTTGIRVFFFTYSRRSAFLLARHTRKKDPANTATNKIKNRYNWVSCTFSAGSII